MQNETTKSISELPVKKKSEYRSAIRSRSLMKEAYAALIQEKQSKKISVSDIIRRADLNRGTFYAHYASPDDVRDEIFDDVICKLNEVLEGFNFANFLQNPYPVFNSVEKLLSDNLEFYQRIVFHTTTESFVGKLKKILVNYILCDKSVPEDVKNGPQFFIALDILAGGMISLYVDYVQGDVDIPIEKITETLTVLVAGISKQFLENA